MRYRFPKGNTLRKGLKPINAFEKGMTPWNKGKKGIMPIPWNKGLLGIFLGDKNPFYGKKHTKETKKKMRLAKLGKTGEEANNWKGGRARNKHSLTDPLYKEWRSKVFERDNWTCQTCGVRSKAGELIYLEGHHIKSWAKYPELRYDVSNGVTLCRECHKLTDNYKNKQNRGI